jgi:hypothetical protein
MQFHSLHEVVSQLGTNEVEEDQQPEVGDGRVISNKSVEPGLITS